MRIRGLKQRLKIPAKKSKDDAPVSVKQIPQTKTVFHLGISEICITGARVTP
jgi:hypothetical protein